MPDRPERSTEMGVAQSTATAAPATHITAAFLQNIAMMASFFDMKSFWDVNR
jgi:hypothetical protein